MPLVTDLFERPIPPPDQTVAYAGDAAQVADLWIPIAGEPSSLVVALHGGWWRAEHDRAHLGHLCRALRDEGFAVVNLEYRRLGMLGGTLRGMLADVAAGVARARGLVKSYAIRDAPPLLVGHSAGGHLALWVAKEASVRGVVALAPISDLGLAASLGLGRGSVEDLLATGDASREEALARASPAERLPIGARQIILHGTDDRGVPLAMSEAYVAKAHSAGDDVELRTLIGVDHVGPIDPESSAFAPVRDALRELA
jgi:acetyl esterase/lipase